VFIINALVHFDVFDYYVFCVLLQDLYCVRSDLGNLLKALGRLDEAKVSYQFLFLFNNSFTAMARVDFSCWGVF